MIGFNIERDVTCADRTSSLAKLARKFIALMICVCLMITLHHAHAHDQQMIVRISEIQVHSEHLDQYKAILNEEAEASFRLEPGVIAIFPMYQQEDPSQVRILEMYADRQAYEAHLKTSHFQKYKTTTLPMVKSLKLVDMHAIDPQTMSKMFSKMKSEK
jgi:quinol monooxygenase YgiN